MMAAWGGSLNEKGSDYMKKVIEAEKVVKYLEELKKELKLDEKKVFVKAIEIITNYVNNLREIKK